MIKCFFEISDVSHVAVYPEGFKVLVDQHWFFFGVRHNEVFRLSESEYALYDFECKKRSKEARGVKDENNVAV